MTRAELLAAIGWAGVADPEARLKDIAATDERVAAAIELGRLALLEGIQDRPIIRTPADLSETLLALIGDRQRECFVCCWLDGGHRLIDCETIHEGGINYATVSARIVVTRALAVGAVAVILAHNHPSGATGPSAEDRALTETLRKAFALVEIRLLDHLLVAGGQVISFMGAP